MTSLQMFLAVPVKSLPTIVLIACGVILAIAFLMGLSRGAYRAGKGGLYWLIASVAFIFAYKFLGDKNPLKLTGSLSAASPAIWAFVLLVACVLIALIIRGLLAVAFKPSANWLREGEWEDMEDDMDDYDYFPVRGSQRGAMKVPGKPGFFSRIVGGLIYMVNAAMVLAIIIGMAVLFIYGTKYRYTKLGEVLKIGIVDFALKYATAYLFDVITVGIIFGIVYRGFRMGALNVTRKVILKLGLLVVIVGGFAIPFIKTTANIYLVRQLINRCAYLFAKMKPVPEMLFAKLTAGAIMAIIGSVIIALINALLRNLTDSIDETPVIRLIDAAIAAVVYLIIGVVVCAAFWGVLYLLDYSGVFRVSDVFVEKTLFARDCFAAAEKFLKGFADKYLLKFVK